jgi:SAM-dependent methyltransferase
MLKMYHDQANAGSTPDFWEENWENNRFEEAVKFCRIDPLRPLFEKYSKPGSLMLEGGCGMGQYLAYYAARGRRVIGLDFAFSTLRKFHAREKDVPLTCGDVSRLPFADGSFDLYYSGGVVEHFEGGAEASLSEARRVLKKDGVLLISVPYFSPLRRALLPFKKKEWRKTPAPAVDADEKFTDRRFFQYAYRKKEFEKMLSAAGLAVRETVGYSFIWGLYDIPFLSGAHGDPGSKTPEKESPAALNMEELIAYERPPSLLKRLLISEDTKIPVAGTFIRFICWTSANMMMYVCTRD